MNYIVALLVESLRRRGAIDVWSPEPLDRWGLRKGALAMMRHVGPSPSAAECNKIRRFNKCEFISNAVSEQSKETGERNLLVGQELSILLNNFRILVFHTNRLDSTITVFSLNVRVFATSNLQLRIMHEAFSYRSIQKAPVLAHRDEDILPWFSECAVPQRHEHLSNSRNACSMRTKGVEAGVRQSSHPFFLSLKAGIIELWF